MPCLWGKLENVHVKSSKNSKKYDYFSLEKEKKNFFSPTKPWKVFQQKKLSANDLFSEITRKFPNCLLKRKLLLPVRLFLDLVISNDLLKLMVDRNEFEQID